MQYQQNTCPHRMEQLGNNIGLLLLDADADDVVIQVLPEFRQIPHTNTLVGGSLSSYSEFFISPSIDLVDLNIGAVPSM